MRQAAAIDLEVVQAYERHAPDLFRYALLIGHDPERARDALQEVFLRFFLARTEGRPIHNPKSWLYRVLRNHMLDLARAAGNDDVCVELLEQPDEDGVNPEVQLWHKQVLRRFAAALSPQELECLQLRGEGLPYEQIARVLAVRPGTVGAVLNRARGKIRKAFSDAIVPNEQQAAREGILDAPHPARLARTGVRRYYDRLSRELHPGEV